MPSHISRGSVSSVGPERNCATTTSSNEKMKANASPAAIAGSSTGSTTRCSVRPCPAPSEAAARSSVGSRLASRAETGSMTKGSTSTVCASPSERKLPRMRSLAKTR